MKKMTLSALSAVIALSAVSAFANNHEMPMPPKDGAAHEKMGGHKFKEHDTNHDGAIGKDEWTAKGDKMFGEIDTNKDGKLSPEETKAHHDKKRDEWKERKAERTEKMKEHTEKKATPDISKQ